ncbi:MAG: LysR substrate-binding domain-containing protein, partial [Betaproteobacteria bacterium]
ADYPKVHLTLHQGSPREIADMLVSGEADVGIATESLDTVPELVSFPFYAWNHGVIVREGHPLLEREVTLEALGEYPIITYHEGFTGRARVDKAFADAGIVPDIVLSAIDADVIKTYVNLELGIGIVAEMAFDPENDRNLRLIQVPGLFPPNVTRLAVRRGTYLRSYALAFIEKVCPDVGEAAITAAIKPQNGADA